MIKYDPDYTPRLADHGGDLTKRWYIDFRIWHTDKHCFVRKQYTGMNKYTSKAKRYAHAKKKLAEITELINQGFTAGKSSVSGLPINLETCTLPEAVEYVISTKAGSLSSETIDQYNGVLARLRECPATTNVPFARASAAVVYQFFEYLKDVRKVGAKTYNDYIGNLSTFFNFYVRLDLISKNPCTRIQRQPVEKSESHFPYTEKQRQEIKAAILEKGDLQLLLFISFIYYTFTRNGKELRLLKVADIRENTIYIPAARAKANRGAHVAIAPALEVLLQQYNLRSYPASYYVFSANGKPGPVPVGINYFYKRHRKILDQLGLTDQRYTVYSYKHTGAINLYTATKDIELVRQHCRHAHAGQTATYLRELGILRNEDALKQFPEF